MVLGTMLGKCAEWDAHCGVPILTYAKLSIESFFAALDAAICGWHAWCIVRSLFDLECALDLGGSSISVIRILELQGG